MEYMWSDMDFWLVIYEDGTRKEIADDEIRGFFMLESSGIISLTKIGKIYDKSRFTDD